MSLDNQCGCLIIAFLGSMAKSVILGLFLTKFWPRTPHQILNQTREHAFVSVSITYEDIYSLRMSQHNMPGTKVAFSEFWGDMY